LNQKRETVVLMPTPKRQLLMDWPNNLRESTDRAEHKATAQSRSNNWYNWQTHFKNTEWWETVQMQVIYSQATAVLSVSTAQRCNHPRHNNVTLEKARASVVTSVQCAKDSRETGPALKSIADEQTTNWRALHVRCLYSLRLNKSYKYRYPR
jgi:hypothetical protein